MPKLQITQIDTTTVDVPDLTDVVAILERAYNPLPLVLTATALPTLRGIAAADPARLTTWNRLRTLIQDSGAGGIRLTLIP